MFKPGVLVCAVLWIGMCLSNAAQITVVNLSGTNWVDSVNTNHIFPPGVTILPASAEVATQLAAWSGLEEGRGYTVWVDAGSSMAMVPDDKSDVEVFMTGFSFVFAAGLLGTGMRWVKKIMVGGYEEGE
jgi:hypothetical protein